MEELITLKSWTTVTILINQLIS